MEYELSDWEELSTDEIGWQIEPIQTEPIIDSWGEEMVYISDPIIDDINIEPWRPIPLDGGKENDRLTGTRFNENLYGWWGDDTLDGGGGNDDIYGHDGNDSLLGGQGSDYLDGGAGNDILDAGGFSFLRYDYWLGDDAIDREFSPEIDTLRGGAGYDTFVLGEGWFDRYIGEGFAIIEDFNHREDYIKVSQELSNYALRSGSEVGYSPTDTAVVLSSNPDEVLAIVRNVSPSNDSIQLSTRDFKYTPRREFDSVWF
jgi:RTX calcium-binding nonapeptide repeat (4 copies)